MAFFKSTRLVLSTLLVLALAPESVSAAEVSPNPQRWHTVTLSIAGPQAREDDPAVNPFADYRMTARLIHPETSHRYEIPGFFAADGNAAETSADAGDRWQVRFSPPLAGRWRYQIELEHNGDAVATKGDTGTFNVGPSDKTGDDFRHHGHLQYVGTRYLRFAGSDRYFLKAGTNSPETLLGYHDFDGTYLDAQTHPIAAPHDPIDLPALDNGLHRFADHIRDWQAGNPTWQNGKGKGLIGGLNYLATHGVNSVYFVTMNVNGDGRNVWPWTGPWQHDRFDVSKLDQWEIVFEHMQSLGIQMHVVLQETENDHILDGGRLGPNRKLYLREMVARFAHHPAVVWNLGEENLQTPDQQRAMAEFIRSIDPYDHPIVMHNDHQSPTNLRDTFDPHLGKSTLNGLSVQDFHWSDVHYHTKYYVDQSRRAGTPWFVCGDEMGGAQYGLPTDQDQPDHHQPRSQGLWGNLMAGGAGVEWYFGWQNNSPHSDLSAETWRPRQTMWDQSKIAVDFFQRYLPFARMESADELTRNTSDYCFAAPGEIYCVYLPQGGNTRLDLGEHDGVYSVRWFDPDGGGELRTGSVDAVWGPGEVSIGTPPSINRGDDNSIASDNDDWVCLVRKTEPVFQSDETADRIVIEAEHYETQTESDIRKWYVLSKSGDVPELQGVEKATRWTRGILSAAKTASGGRYIKLLPDTRQTHADKLIRGINFSPEPGKMAILSYRVQFSEAGRYYVWVRAYPTGTEDNGIHVGLNEGWPEHGQRMQWSGSKNRWVWGCAQRTETVHTGVPMEIYLDIPEPGVHTITFSMREDGFTFDQFLLTTDRDYRPRGIVGGERVRPPRHVSSMQPAKVATTSPHSRGVDPKGLRRALAYAAGICKDDKLDEMIILRDAKMIYRGEHADRVHNIWSCSKSFTSTVLGLLIADKRCTLDTKVCEVFPEYRQQYPDATLRHFTTMTSGFNAVGRSRWKDENSDWSWTPYDPAEPHFAPGTAYAYWDEAQMTLGRLLTRIGEREMRDYLQERVFDPIELGEVQWLHEGEVDGIPINNGCTNVMLSADQLARFGQLFLHRGRWNGRQIIPAEWIDAATQNQVSVDLPVGNTDRDNVRGPGAYGFNWWTCGGENPMPDAPRGTYYASGLNHNLLFVVPEWDMVIVRMGTDGNPPMGKPQAWNEFFRLLNPAVMRSEVKRPE